MSAGPVSNARNRTREYPEFGNRTVVQVGNSRLGSRAAIHAWENPAGIDIFGQIAPFRRARMRQMAVSGQIDENGSLPYKPRQLSAVTRSDRDGSFGPETARFGRPASADLPH